MSKESPNGSLVAFPLANGTQSWFNWIPKFEVKTELHLCLTDKEALRFWLNLNLRLVLSHNLYVPPNTPLSFSFCILFLTCAPTFNLSLTSKTRAPATFPSETVKSFESIELLNLTRIAELSQKSREFLLWLISEHKIVF